LSKDITKSKGGVTMSKRKWVEDKRIEVKGSKYPLMIPVRHRLLPLTIVETTERILGVTSATRYLLRWKNLIFGPVVR